MNRMLSFFLGASSARAGVIASAARKSARTVRYMGPILAAKERERDWRPLYTGRGRKAASPQASEASLRGSIFWFQAGRLVVQPETPPFGLDGARIRIVCIAAGN